MEKRIKLHKRYWLYRVYSPIALVLWFVYLKSRLPFPYHQLFFLGEFVNVMMVLNLSMFHYGFSIYGPYEKTPLPTERPVLVDWSLMRIGLLGAGGFGGLRVYHSGLGVSMMGIGKAFISINEISKINKGMISWSIEHNNPEIYSPIIIANYRVIDELQNIIKSHNNSQ